MIVVRNKYRKILFIVFIVGVINAFLLMNLDVSKIFILLESIAVSLILVNVLEKIG